MIMPMILHLLTLLSFLSLLSLSYSYNILSKVLLLQGQVSIGYGRGSKKLGIPTANLPHYNDLLLQNNYQRGVYFGWGIIENDGSSGGDACKIYGCVANIGISPTFQGQENAINIVEAHILDRNSNTDSSSSSSSSSNDFYGSNMRLALVSFLRPEQKFQSFDALINQINADINTARNLRDSTSSSSNDEAMSRAYSIAKDFFRTSFDIIEIRTKYKDSIVVNTNTNSQALWCTVPL